ncbi:NAD-dependent protein deacetylase sirtuin-1 [Chrysoperla carnea]|uniref:NAD-dependent protein deacetylase sirtuin-1 n=1 Tax=Chrysoperla carnea TaxID=189513 RepID=UPI001D06FC62|nr:NAD-dependent protein deacetylase sirtuin-1 [Chrysoperla carnea]
MASASDHSDFEIPFKRRKHDTEEISSTNSCSNSQFETFSSFSENHLDVCEGTSTDSGFNEFSFLDKDARTCITRNPIKKITADSQLIERIFAMRGIIDEKLWLELTCQLFTPPPRQRLLHISRFVDVIKLIRSSRRILVLTGAGVSVSCGIPDFRSRDGIYARLAQDFPDLPDPHAMFDSGYFRQDPRPFFKFAKEIYPGRFSPSASHKFIKALESHGRLLRNYTQNIDTLERAAGINRVIECHGSFAQATCTRCQHTVDAEDIREDIFEQRIPVCKNCNPNSSSISATDLNVNFTELVENGIMKPNITFFGEDLPSKFYKCIQVDRTSCDLLLVIGSSLKVRPVAEVPASLPPNIPQILINRERLPHCTFDVELLGDSDVIVSQICHRLGESWNNVNWSPPLKRTKLLNRPINNLPSRPSSTATSPNTSLYHHQTASSSSHFSNIGNDHSHLTNFSYENSLFDKDVSNSVTDDGSTATIPSESEESSCLESESCTFSNTLRSSSSCLMSNCSNNKCTLEMEATTFDNEIEINSNKEYTNEFIKISNKVYPNSFSPSSISFDDGTGTDNTCTTTVSTDSSDFNEFNHSETPLNYHVHDSEYEENSFHELNTILKNDRLDDHFSNWQSTTNHANNTSSCQTKTERHHSIDSGINDDYDLSHVRVNVSECLPENTFMFRPPNKYIFPGAEVKIKCKYLKFMK